MRERRASRQSHFARAARSAALLAGLCAVVEPASASGPPNIVWIMADDLGWSDTSNPITNRGNPSDFYETPTIDRLAREGMAFTDAYASGASCAPTRAALLTGQYASRPTNNVFSVGHLDKFPGSLLKGAPQGLPSGTDAIPPAAFTFAEALQQAGYQTAHVGKFHMTEMGAAGAAQIVTEHGFDRNYGGTQVGNPGAYHARHGSYSQHVGPELDAFAKPYTGAYVTACIKPFSNGVRGSDLEALAGAPKHLSDAMTDAALAYLAEAVRDPGGRPFFLQFHPYAVHTPVQAAQARPDLLAKYERKPAGAADRNAPFAALLEGLDQNIARLVRFLETEKDPRSEEDTLAENTIVFFYSDNGGRLPQSNNGPLRGDKGCLTEGGIRVPLVAWSGNRDLVDGGSVNATPVASIDFYKTFLSLAHATAPPGVQLDGRDLAPILASRTAKLDREALFWHYPGNNRQGTQPPQSAVRAGDWKLIYSYEDQSFQLYDLARDLGEANNLVADHREKAAELGLLLLLWLEDQSAPLATLREGSLEIDVRGPMYANGRVESHNARMTIHAGDEAPYVLGDLLSLADLDRDSHVAANDWALLRPREATPPGLPTIEGFRRGDLDADGDVDERDVDRFAEAYIAVHGAEAFGALPGSDAALARRTVAHRTAEERSRGARRVVGQRTQ